MSAASEDRLLSIAIPVHNFGAFLPQTLDSILDQTLAEKIEVLVFDGGSTDNTPHVARSYARHYPNFRYVRALKKGGIDADMARCVELASTPYCWLFSGDDVMLPGAIEKVLNTLRRWQPDLVLSRHNECTVDMTVLKDWPVLSIKTNKVFDLQNGDERSAYLEAARTSEAFLSFMGGLVIKRQRWFQGRLTPSFNGSNWAHIGRLWSLMDEPFRLAYLHEVLLNRRGGNDSFSKDGMLSRLGIQIDGLLDIIESIFGAESMEARHLRRVIKTEVEPDWANTVRRDLQNRHAPQKDFERLDQMLSRIA
ncbi:glycosyltransferase family 2 protein [Hylemonella gracilis]|uniref:Glycosyl transferase family protein n=1 Tax=Hylemonella gracilis ATCC 19624 TaxID=887062 RepID=F3KSE6_9BURK|nr:glycosyltransferase family 2 protein [Hylemonella gracilis]EGI77340.1 glycosyl transferase family protein [Hylemonella gracilis ATCC 19624]